MKFIVDKYPNYNSDCPFYENNWEEATCKISGEVCPNSLETPEHCGLISFEDYVRNEGLKNE